MDDHSNKTHSQNGEILRNLNNVNVSLSGNQLAKFKVYASNDPTSFISPGNLCHVSTIESSLPGDWMRLKCKKIFTSRYVFVQADAKMDNSNRELTICEMKASSCLYLFTGKQNIQLNY